MPEAVSFSKQTSVDEATPTSPTPFTRLGASSDSSRSSGRSSDSSALSGMVSMPQLTCQHHCCPLCTHVSGVESASHPAAVGSYHTRTWVPRGRVQGSKNHTPLFNLISLLFLIFQKLPNPIFTLDDMPRGTERKNRYSNVLPCLLP